MPRCTTKGLLEGLGFRQYRAQGLGLGVRLYRVRVEDVGFLVFIWFSVCRV